MGTTKYTPQALLTAKKVDDVISHYKKLEEFRREYIKPVSELKKKAENLKATAVDLADDYERPGRLVKLTIDVVLKRLSEVVGPVSEHPYVKLHELHFKALIDLAKALSASNRARQNLRAAFEVAKAIQSKHAQALGPYRRDGKKFSRFKESMNPVFLGAWLVRGQVEADVADRGPSLQTLGDIFAVGRLLNKVHEEARNQVDEIFEIYTGLHQSLGAVRSLRAEATRLIERMNKEKGATGVIGRTFGAATQYAADRDMISDPDSDMLMTENLHEPIEQAIRETDSVIMDWVQADQKFTDDLFKLDVFAAMNGKMKWGH